MTNLRVVDDFAQRIPDLLESTTERVRSMTVDRVARVLTFLALGMVATVLVGMAMIFLFVGLFRILGDVATRVCGCNSGMEIAYAVVGGLFLLLGALLWSKRMTKDEETSDE